MFRFESPWMFLLLVPLAALVVWRRADQVRLRFSSTVAAARLRGSLRSRLARLPLLLRALALVALVAALARPQFGSEQIRDISRGIAIGMVVDRSSSMGERMRFGGSTVTRLDAVKRVFRDFVDPAEGEMGGRPNDLVGMTTFAQYADSVCPLTLSHDTLIQLLDTVRLVEDRREDGTAIGDAVALAAARLRRAEQATPERRSYEIKSKIVILLTDGENNAGDRSVRDAAELCRQWDIKVYAIGVGDERGLQTRFGRLSAPLRRGFDDRALREIADLTGGKYWLAADAGTLRSVHEEINELEKSEFEAERFVDYKEAFAPWALAALAMLSLESLLRLTVLRTVP
jgi:Ca-activated chloride channel family protein